MQNTTFSTTTLASAGRLHRRRSSTRSVTKGAAALWTIQGLLAVTFAGAGVSKLADPGAAANSSNLPAAFMAFIGVCEVAGAAGLILPGVTNIGRWLTPLAATGLVIIMIGATIVTGTEDSIALAVMPLLIGILASIVAYRRARAAFAPARRS
jgi:hypothetical protein